MKKYVYKAVVDVVDNNGRHVTLVNTYGHVKTTNSTQAMKHFMADSDAVVVQYVKNLLTEHFDAIIDVRLVSRHVDLAGLA